MWCQLMHVVNDDYSYWMAKFPHPYRASREFKVDDGVGNTWLASDKACYFVGTNWT